VTLQADLIAANEEIAAKQGRMAELLSDIDSLPADKARERADAIKSANTELADLGEKRDKIEADVVQIERAREAVKAARHTTVGGRQVVPATEDDDSFEDEPAIKSVGALLRQALDTTGLKSRRDGFRGYRGPLGEMAVKTLITTSNGPNAQNTRLPQIVGYPTEERTVGDLMLQGTTGGSVVEYYEETTFTNSAAETAEAGAKPESALAFTLRTANVAKIATWVPVTDEMLADVPAFESYIRERLGYMVKAREELELLRGDGASPNLQGILNRSGINTVTGYGQSTLDSLYTGITKCRTVGFAEPTAYVMHPNDWENVRLSKDTTGNYLLGPATGEGPQRVWGLEVRVTTNMLENTALVGAFRPHAQIFRRSGIDLAISTENEDYFLKNKVAVRAEERLALAVYRPSAFTKIESIVIGS
jgi:HK97 family phage major capsid protein